MKYSTHDRTLCHLSLQEEHQRPSLAFKVEDTLNDNDDVAGLPKLTMPEKWVSQESVSQILEAQKQETSKSDIFFSFLFFFFTIDGFSCSLD